ncbi:MAG: aldo/keto reductase [Myxococcota bacterium]
MNRTTLDTYRLLGRSGLRVSPLGLGAMTFGTDWGWGADDGETRRMFDMYVDRGGNFIDTANAYTNGSSERLVGELTRDKRERLVIATKYSLSVEQGNPNAGGNHRKSMMRSVEQSLKRLQTDYIDLFYLHVWDGRTPADEVMRAFDDLVRAGKVLHVGISDTPAWRVAQMQTMAELRGWAPLVALQIEYSLIQRSVEADLMPMAKELGLGVIPWSPLAGGVLTGKYSRADLQVKEATAVSSGRKEIAAGLGMLSERGLRIADVVKSIAAERKATPAQVALAWTLQHDAVASPIIGARTVKQLEDNLGALDVEFSQQDLARLDEVSRVQHAFPHEFLENPMVRQQVLSGTKLLAS